MSVKQILTTYWAVAADLVLAATAGAQYGDVDPFIGCIQKRR